jgi:MFS family permease
MLGVVSLFTDVSSEMIHSVLPLFLVQTLGASIATVGVIEGLAEATASVVKVFSGALSDRWGSRKGLAIAGYGLSTVMKPLFSLATNPLWVLLARFGDRVGKGIRVAPRDALVADVTTPENRGAAYGLRQSLDTVGALLGPLLAFGLMSTSGQNFRLVFALALLPGVLAVGVLAIGVRESRSGQSKTDSRSLHRPLRLQALKSLGYGYWSLLGVALLFNLGNSSEAFLLLQAKQVGVFPNFVPLTLVVMNLAYALTAYPVGVLTDRIGRVGMLISGYMLYALVYLGFAVAQAGWQIWALFALYGLHLGMSQGVLAALIADQVPSSLRGTAFGLINLAMGVALLPASLLAGWLWQQVHPAAAFLTGSGFAIAAIVLFALTFRKQS